MTASIGTDGGNPELHSLVMDALRQSGLEIERSTRDAREEFVTAIKALEIGVDDVVTVIKRGPPALDRAKHLVVLQSGQGLLDPRARLRRRELELRVQMSALAAAPAAAVNAIVIDAALSGLKPARDIAAAIRFIISTTAMTGQVFLLG